MDLERAKAVVSRASSAEPRVLSPLAGCAIIATWNTTSTLILFPGIFGVLGYLGGILCVFAIQGLAWAVSRHVIDLTAFYGDVDTFSELGERLLGRLGRRLFLAVQMSNQVAFLVYAVALLTSSLQHLFFWVDFLQCNVNACLLVLLAGFAIVQISRDWKDFHWLAFITWGLATLLAAVLIAYAAANPGLQYGGPTPAFVGMAYDLPSSCAQTNQTGAPCQPPSSQYSFLSVMGALGSVLFSFAPCFILVELMSEMAVPRAHARLALDGAFAYSTTVYLTMGLIFSLLWGNQVPSTVLSVLPDGSWQSLLSQFIILVAMVLDLVIAVLVLNRFVVHYFRPDFDFAWTARNAVVWASVTFLPVASTFLLALFVPHLTSIISLVDAFSIPWAQLLLPALSSLPVAARLGRGHGRDGSPVQRPALPAGKTVVLAVAAAVGGAFSLLEAGIFVYDLTQLSFSGSYWCDGIAAL